MVSDKKVSQDPADVSYAEKRVKRARLDGRQRFYTALLLFVVIAGLPVVAVPSLKQRLTARVSAIKYALSGRIDPVTIETSEESLPFPEEYEKNVTLFPGPGGALPLERIFTAQIDEPDPVVYDRPSLISPERSQAGYPEFEPIPEVTEPEPDAAESDSGDGLGYAQGEVETDAYAMLLESYPQVEAMVNGDEPGLRFLSWGAVKRGEDLYWVRLIFETDENPSVEYIWSVELEGKRVLPLSHNARSII